VAPLIEQPENEWLARMWWFYATIAEALFGLKRHDEAVAWLQRGIQASGGPPEWEYQSTIKQLTHLALLQHDPLSKETIEATSAWRALKRFFGDAVAPVRSAFLGKVGLALSGGGFRASLFHIGVMAKLAELDLLRHIEVLSCVSGGSIVGSHFYLEVRHLLQSKPDGDITRQDYIDIVARIQKHFLAGVQRNIRTRVASEFLTNVMMLFRSDYSRTLRAGELYEREIFSRVGDGEGKRPRWLNHLYITPVEHPDGFNPKIHNWRRAAKAPILILNATTLNTGHNWQFTASWMGEPPAGVDSDVDGNEVLRRMYYWEAPEAHRQMRLGHAVAASACVPGIFEPLTLSGLYPERTVRLVDGGVCDNQGILGLLEQDCNVILVSDGSGQMSARKDPAAGVLTVPLRSTSITQARVRESQFRDLRARCRSLLVRGLTFVHLKEDLDEDPVDWVDCLDPFEASDQARPPERKGPLTRYGIAKPMQLQLATMRTDLDSFSDIEAYSLMTSGYRMIETQIAQSSPILGLQQAAEPVLWEFLAVEQGMKGSGKSYQFQQRVLGVSHSKAFKIWKLSTPLKVLSWLMAIGALAGAGWACRQFGSMNVVPAISLESVCRSLAIAAAGMVAGTYLFGRFVLRAVRWRDALQRIAIFIIMSIVGSLLARVHLLVFDKWFLRYGSLRRVQRLRSQ
jgi:predicted acylesterase/phospholipase RssA